MSTVGINKSEVAQFRETQTLQEQSALLALNGFAQTASHDIIAHKFTQDTEKVRALFEAGDDEAALALWESLQW